MPKRLFDRCAPDSIREFLDAARVRSRDAQVLAEAGRRTAAIYLWGYSAEMTIKAAYLRLVGFPERQSITMADLRFAAASAAGLGYTWPGPPGRYNLHDVSAWANLLVKTRAIRSGLSYPEPRFGNRVLREANYVKGCWNETLRYHRNQAYLFEVEGMRRAVEWMMANSRRL